MGEQEIENKAKKWPQILAAGCVCIGAIGNGSVVSWTSNINSDLLNGTLNDIKLSRPELSWVGSFMALGAIFMCFIAGFLADLIGRKFTILVASVPFIIGWLLIFFARNVEMIYFGRILTGSGNGAFCITAPLYTTETSQKEIRGMVGTFYQLFLTVGILYGNFFGKFAPMKTFILLCLAIPVIFAIIFAFMPETPVYLLKKNKPEKAIKAIKSLRGSQYDPTDELKQMQDNINAAQFSTMALLRMLKTKQVKKSSLICFALMFYQKLSGVNALNFYMQDILGSAGFSLDAKTSTIMVGTIQVFATGFASQTIEKWGRKALLMLSDFGASMGTLVIATYFMLQQREVLDPETVKTISFLPVTGLMIYIVSFSIGLGPIPWLMSAELFPPPLRARLTAAAAASNWFWAFIVGKYYVTIADAVGTDVTFFIFSGVSFSGIFFVWFVMPETKNKTFDEIQSELGR